MEKQGNILVVDDDQGVLHTIRMILKNDYAKVVSVDKPDDIPVFLKEDVFDLVILDMNFKPGDTSGQEGLQWLKKIRQFDPEIQILVNTAYGDIKIAVEAMKYGAVDFLTKDWTAEKLKSSVKSIMSLCERNKQLHRLRLRERHLQKEVNRQYVDIITCSANMKSLLESMEKIAATDANVLVLGENGTGKELIARRIHQLSNRVNEAFIKVDLGALSTTLFESELFGHVKGAYTDAKEDRPGWFEIASGGTLFLDEIGNISAEAQAKLLTIIQNREVIRVGANKAIPLDIRLICATNQPVLSMVSQGNFRQDLLYRINTVELRIPPLRERIEDIPLLIEHYLKLFTAKYKTGSLKLSASMIEDLGKYTWPGNIRELQHAVERAVILNDVSKLVPKDINSAKLPKNEDESLPILKISELEKKAIQSAIDRNQGNFTKAASDLGLGRTTLYRKMKRYGLWIED